MDLQRPSIHEILMRQAFLISERGTCSRRRVGAVIATDEGVSLSSGYNGALTGMPHCAPHDDYLPCERSEHAERNAIYWAARRGIATLNTILYCTDSPCIACSRAIVQAGIKRVYWARPYRDDAGVILLLAAGVEAEQYEVLNDQGTKP